MINTIQDISVKGKIHQVPAVLFGDIKVVIRGRFIKVAQVFDEYWLQAHTLPNPNQVLEQLQHAQHGADLFTFSQRVPDITPRFNFHRESDNVAVIPVSSHDVWFREQISSASRRNLRTSQKKGIVVRCSEFDEAYVQGIISIFNESPVRGGRRYWHYGKDFAQVEAENGTYRERSTFLGAYFEGKMIGYMKIVWDQQSGAIMQILSKMEFRDKRPNNALLSEAVKLCAEKHVPYLLYERYVYGNKTESSLTRFKRENGFIRMDIPRYYVPLNSKGRVALVLGLHRSIKDRLPQGLVAPLIRWRSRWYESGGGKE